MFRIKLSGNQKTKNIILIILVIISIALLIVIALDNKKNSGQEVNVEKQENITIESPIKQDKLESKKEETNEFDMTEADEKGYQEAFDTFHSGNYQLTISKADKLIEKNHNNYKAFSIRGIAKAYNGNFEEGIKDINKALEIKSDYRYAIFNKALAYELYAKYDEALKWYDKALEQEEYLWSYYGKASIYGRKGDVNNTVKYLTKALELAKKEGNEADVKKIIKEEEDFNNVKNSKEFKKLVY